MRRWQPSSPALALGAHRNTGAFWLLLGKLLMWLCRRTEPVPSSAPFGRRACGAVRAAPAVDEGTGANTHDRRSCPSSVRPLGPGAPSVTQLEVSPISEPFPAPHLAQSRRTLGVRSPRHPARPRSPSAPIPPAGAPARSGRRRPPPPAPAPTPHWPPPPEGG